jgi:hypothetical protein
VYPVSVALYRQGTAAPLARFTTFLTYQEPGVSASDGPDGPLRVALVMPISGRLLPDQLVPRRRRARTGGGPDGDRSPRTAGVAVSVAANPATVASLVAGRQEGAARPITQLRALTTAPVGDDQLIAQPYVPIDVAALANAG